METDKTIQIVHAGMRIETRSRRRFVRVPSSVGVRMPWLDSMKALYGDFWSPAETARYTIAWRRLEDNRVEYAVAFCSPRDRFVKKRGAEIARDRLESQTRVYVSEEPVAYTRHDAHSHIKDCIAASPELYLPHGWTFLSHL